MTEASFIVRRLDRSRAVEVNPWARAIAADGDKPKWPRCRRRRPALDRIVQSCGDEGAHADAPGSCFAAHLCRKPVFKRDRRSHVCIA